MKKYLVCIAVATVFFLMLTAPESESATKLTQKTQIISHANAKITFSAVHMLIMKVKGEFEDFAGTFSTNSDDLHDAKLAITIKVKSLKSNNPRRDNHLRSEDFFESDKYPLITFVSQSFSLNKQEQCTIKGYLTIKKMKKLITITGVRSRVNDKYKWALSFVLNRFDYNIKYQRSIDPGGNVISELITMTIEAETE